MSHKPRKIAVVAPASPPDRAAMEASMDLIRQWGHEVIPGQHLFAVHSNGYTAGSTEQRAQDLLWALQDPDIDTVWIARGGFGVQHCLRALEGHEFKDKTIIGYSDVTALLYFLWLRGQRNLIHGPLVDTLATEVDEVTRNSIRQALDEPTKVQVLRGESIVNTSSATLHGPLLGGNITMLASLSGTPWAFRAQGAILLLEDITEHAFRLDRSLLHLQHAGALEGVKAIVLGEFVRCYLPAGVEYTIDELVTDLLRPLGVPIVRGVPFGHGKTNLGWTYGRTATLDGLELSF